MEQASGLSPASLLPGAQIIDGKWKVRPGNERGHWKGMGPGGSCRLAGISCWVSEVKGAQCSAWLTVSVPVRCEPEWTPPQCRPCPEAGLLVDSPALGSRCLLPRVERKSASVPFTGMSHPRKSTQLSSEGRQCCFQNEAVKGRVL